MSTTLGTVTLFDAAGSSKQFRSGDVVAARHYLVNGNCHSLALALHDLTGYAIGCFREISKDTDSTSTVTHIRHVAVVSPEGWVLDGYGVSSLTEVTHDRSWSVELYDREQNFLRALARDASEYNRVWMPENKILLMPFAAAILYMHNW